MPMLIRLSKLIALLLLTGGLTFAGFRWLATPEPGSHAAASAVPADATASTGVPSAIIEILPAKAEEPWPEIKWDDLIPNGWEPLADIKGLDFSQLQDTDPRAMEALDRLRQTLDNAPTEPSLNGMTGRIAGFALPLERKGDKVTEFLIVPYFGACIHAPPPPANQTIHAKAKKPLAGLKMMSPIWSYGTFAVTRGETTWGVSGYQLSVEKIAAYEKAARQ